MEKFCIVKRRKQGLQDSFPTPLPISEEEFGPWNDDFGPPPEIISNKEPVLSFSLTPAQSRALRSGGILPLLGTDKPKFLNLNLHQEEDGSIVFHFHLDQDHDLTMLKSVQVCQMMQISRNLLNRMVQGGKIKSYKIGRLRRFCIKDIHESLESGSGIKKPFDGKEGS
jgi:excisionase family DNA binding protein